MQNKLKIFYYKKNRLQQLKSFCALIENKTIQKTADKLNISISQISLQIKSLSEELKTNLFIKNGRNIKPTLQAIALYNQIHLSVNIIDNTIENFLDLKKNIQNEINIIGHHYILTYIILPIINNISNDNPNIKATLKISNKKQTIEAIKTGKSYIGIYPLEDCSLIKYKNINFYKLIKYEPIILFHKDHPINKIKNIKFSDITKYDFIESEDYYIPDDFILRFFNKNLRYKISLSEIRIDTISELVRNNLGIAIFDRRYAEKANLNDCIIKNISDIKPNIHYYLMIHKDSIKTKLIEKIVCKLKTI